MGTTLDNTALQVKAKCRSGMDIENAHFQKMGIEVLLLILFSFKKKSEMVSFLPKGFCS